jgi:LEA14-like dessication related protein
MLKCTRLMLLAFVVWTAACSLLTPKFERPTLSVASVEMVSGNLFQQNFLVTFDIQNPNDRVLPVTSLHAELNVGGDRFASGVTNRAFVVPARGATQFDMTITANMALALVKLGQKSGQHPDSIDYDMTGGASIDLPFMRDLPFHQSGSFPLRLPH